MNAMQTNQQKTSTTCEMGTLQRVRYFPRQLITPVEMTLDQNYARDRQRRHNRLLHGWGVVCGAEVCADPNPDGTWQPWKVRVKPGYALAPKGDEIAISKERELDLRVASAVGCSEDMGGEMSDPWCRPVYREALPEWVYLAVRFREVMTRQVRAQPAGCGCDDASCEYSRICDGYEFGVLPDCPLSHQNPPAVTDLAALINSPLEACPECPDEDWVVLAAVQVDLSGRILTIDNCGCRRMVVSFAGVWGKCTGNGLKIDAIGPAKMVQGQEYDISIKGSNFNPQATLSLGTWAAFSNINIQPSQINAHVVIASDAPVGARSLVVTNPDCSLATIPVQISEKPAGDSKVKKVDEPKGRRRGQGTN